ncbi:atypical chemokine receptor 3 [Hemicordylus capensis]|uniref:atypical chemokine receptor 3 n=1 Tax=Hemicordylus capensis TaxID=884348 RepID=UPI00230274A3|nr:atypical chemokine receptor 3 [Hemicordylus capensis]
MNTIDLPPIFDLLEVGNLTEANLTCSNGDCITVDSLSCPNTVNKNALLYILSIFYIFIFIIGLVANFLVVWMNFQAKTTGYETHLYIFNLAIADLCVIITLPVWVVSLAHHTQWHMGEIMCKITHLVFSINLYGSIFFLACMSMDRYLSVAYFTTSGTIKKKIIRRCICIFVWLFAFFASLPDTYYLKTVSSNNETYCRPIYPEESAKEWLAGMELSSVVLGFIIPFPIITVFYCLLARTISASNDQERKSNGKIIFSYIVVFLFCWLPYHVVALLDLFLTFHFIPFSCQMENFIFTALHVTQCFSLIHCCVNPILYSFINRNYKYELMKAFIFKYSAKTGLTKLIDTSRVSEMEYSALEQNAK